jgi:hypothetical protein
MAALEAEVTQHDTIDVVELVERRVPVAQGRSELSAPATLLRRRVWRASPPLVEDVQVGDRIEDRVGDPEPAVVDGCGEGLDTEVHRHRRSHGAAPARMATARQLTGVQIVDGLTPAA